MAVYLKEFETQAAYEAAQSSLILPNVSLTVDNNTVHYNPYVEPVETRVVTKFNVTSISRPTQIIGEYSDSPFSAIEIDDVVLPSVVSAYTFSTTGEHTVKYTLTNQTSIGFKSFQNCYGLTSIDIPNSVTSIGENAFQSCSGLTSCAIGDSVTSIGGGAFGNCSGLTSVTIGNGVTSIGNYAFFYCSGLTSVIVNTTTPPTLGNNAFNNNASGRKIYVPSESVETYKSASGWSNYASDIEPIQ